MPSAGGPDDPEDRDFVENEGSRRAGPLESLYQEFVRRAAVMGLSGFALTEEAVRRALSESMPRDWVEYWARQGTDVRKEVVESLVGEFGEWLGRIDPLAFQRNMLRTLLEDFEISLEIKISARPREQSDGGRSLELVRRRK